MKVLHIIPSISPKLGGPTQVVLNLVRALRKEGIDVEIATTNDDDGLLLNVPLLECVEYQGLPVWFFPHAARIKAFLPSLAFTQWLWQNIKNYDILDNHYLFSYLPSCAAIFAQWQQVPYTVRIMGQLTPWALAQSKLKKHVYSYLIEKRNLNQAAAIHCTSVGEMEDVIAFGVKPPKVVLPLGVNPPTLIGDAKSQLQYRYNVSEEVPIILFLSRLHYKKRPELLIQTLGELKKQEQNFYLLIAGSGQDTYVQSLQKMVASLNITNQTSFVGFVSGYEKDLLLQGSDLFVLPTYSENFGIALAEAMVSGLPIITTPGVQIAPEIDEAEAGIIVEGEIGSLKSAIADLLKNPQLREKMGKNGRLVALQRYSWQTVAQQLVSTYQAILNQEQG
ncbi:glycosyltransferase [Trichormus azollae]|jgi:glycosyltransferase involved in cell wall biosynthesis|uniref:Glycosyl transferase group 1 n=1 Tax=Nostoc azollae (strain 0708) TaxID=551115 RepID=D7DZ36_NOSA0|nr:glycosyltransferase [Trichormus azollae]ADI66057.1 glycosyl transferase group 1 ['Nostoc azollae' 0708]